MVTTIVQFFSESFVISIAESHVSITFWKVVSEKTVSFIQMNLTFTLFVIPSVHSWLKTFFCLSTVGDFLHMITFIEPPIFSVQIDNTEINSRFSCKYFQSHKIKMVSKRSTSKNVQSIWKKQLKQLIKNQTKRFINLEGSVSLIRIIKLWYIISFIHRIGKD